MHRTWLIAMTTAAVACGARGPAAPTQGVANHAAPPPSPTERAIATLHQLAAALRDDTPLAPVLDPDGTELIWVPADIPTPWFIITPEATQTMHELMAMHGWRDAWGDYSGIWRDIEAGLASLDLDPPELIPGVHTTECDSEAPRSQYHGYLRTHDLDEPYYDDGHRPRSPPFTLEFRYLWTTIYLIDRGDRMTIGRIEPADCE